MLQRATNSITKFFESASREETRDFSVVTILSHIFLFDPSTPLTLETKHRSAALVLRIDNFKEKKLMFLITN